LGNGMNCKFDLSKCIFAKSLSEDIVTDQVIVDISFQIFFFLFSNERHYKII
jgi:hypothetical protein